MSDPNRPRRAPSGAQHWRDQDDPRAPQRDSRPGSRSQSDPSRPPLGSTRPPSRSDGDSRARGDRGDRGDRRYDDGAPPRQPKPTRVNRPSDGWDDEEWNGRDWDDDRPRRSSRARPSRDHWDDEPERGHARRAAADGTPHRSSRDPRDNGGRGPRGWDDHAWQDDHTHERGWDGDGWEDDGWGQVDDRPRPGRDVRQRVADEGDGWRPASQRSVGGQGRQLAARAGSAWKNATSQVASVVKRPSTLRERLRTDKRARIVAIAVLVAVLFCLIPTPILAYSNTMALAKDGITHLKNAENDFKTLATSPTNLTTINDAQSELQHAHDDFAQLQLRMMLASPAALLPKVGSKVSGANKLLPLAVDGTQAGVLACDAMKTLVTGLKNPLGTSGGLTSANVTQITSDIDQIHTLYGQMQPILASLTESDLSLDPALWPTVSGLQAKLPQVTQLVNDLDGMAHALPQLLGVGKPATYLVLVLDSSELRPTGGFIGNFGALTVDSGRLDPTFHVSDITLIDGSVKFPQGYGPGQVPYVLPAIPIPSKYNWLKTVFQDPNAASWSLRDSNLDPDYPTASQYALQLYQQLMPTAQKNLGAQHSSLALYDPAKSGPFAGVVTLSLGFFAQALNITGPIQVNDHTIHETVTAQNFVDKIHEYALSSSKMQGPDSQACGDTSCAKVFTSDVVKAFMTQVKTHLSDYLGKLAKLAYDSLRTKDIEIYLTPAPAQQLLQDLKVASTVQAPKTGDTVFEVEANIGANKDNYFLQYQMQDQINLSQAGDATHKLLWSYRWKSNFSDPQVVFPAGVPDYHSYSRVIAPSNASYLSQTNLKGFGTDKPSTDTFGLTVFHGAAYAPFPYGSGAVGPYRYGVSWKVPGVVTHDSAGYHYTLLFQREAGIVWPLTVTVTLPTCAHLAGAPVVSGTTSDGTVAVKNNVVTITGPLTMNEQYQINWTC